MLEEVARGGDGRGLVLVSGTVPGGNAESSGNVSWLGDPLLRLSRHVQRHRRHSRRAFWIGVRVICVRCRSQAVGLLVLLLFILIAVIPAITVKLYGTRFFPPRLRTRVRSLSGLCAGPFVWCYTQRLLALRLLGYYRSPAFHALRVIIEVFLFSSCFLPQKTKLQKTRYNA